ncbi:hypothetical protein SO802_006581 [Lithocarpus litseifolius]|uniref:Peptidase A1 domain-containing protein n=1 Tax=Lithocarpus litseifolius TaxID=425828 RepID=A0AAW2DPD9_9ROSI
MNFANAINSTKQGIKALEPQVLYHPGNFYVAEMGIGTPPYTAILLVDTGSNTTWIQGEGCNVCFPPKVGNFKYKESWTYSHVPCYHPLCFPRICHRNLCVFYEKYNDGSHSRGYISFDKFTFPSQGGGYVSYQNVVFGVGLDNKNIESSRLRGSENTVAGVLGLGSGDRSILKQLEADTYLRFSYCLPHWTNRHNTHTYLHFGQDAQIRGTGQAIVKKTPLLPYQNRYYLKVLGISMEGKYLQINPNEFQMRVDFTGGFAIDSGSSYTYLVQNAYNIVRAEIVRYLQAYNWNPTVHSELPYDLCYDVNPTENQKFPSLTIHFLEADLELGAQRVFELFYSNTFCMFIIPTSQQGTNLLGAFQQSDFRFLFDVKAHEMWFVEEKCHLN